MPLPVDARIATGATANLVLVFMKALKEKGILSEQDIDAIFEATVASSGGQIESAEAQAWVQELRRAYRDSPR